MLVVAAVAFGVAWLIAELRGRLGFRVGFGLSCIAALALELNLETWRNTLIDAHTRACMRQLGEALDQGDLQRASKAVAAYNKGESGLHPTLRMLDALEKK